MDQQFESDVMQDLMADSPTVSADDAFEQETYDEGFEGDGMEEDAMSDEFESFDESSDEYEGDAFLESDEFEEEFEEDMGDEFSEDEMTEGDFMDEMNAMEEVVADALDAEDSDEFLSRLISGIRNVAGIVGRGAGIASRVAGRAQRIAGQAGRVARGVQGLADAIAGPQSQPRRRGGRRRRAGAATPRPAPMSGLLQQLLPMLQQHMAQGSNEMEVFEDLADWFEEEEADEAMPIIAGMAARAAIRPILRRGATMAGRALRRRIVRGATQGARRLVQKQGPRAVRAIRPIAKSVGRAVVRQGIKPAVIPKAITKTAARVAAQPALTRRLSRPALRTGIPVAPRRYAVFGRKPHRMLVNGPVEIIIRR